jgi:hypothetical protein
VSHEGVSRPSYSSNAQRYEWPITVDCPYCKREHSGTARLWRNATLAMTRCDTCRHWVGKCEPRWNEVTS